MVNSDFDWPIYDSRYFLDHLEVIVCVRFGNLLLKCYSDVTIDSVVKQIVFWFCSHDCSLLALFQSCVLDFHYQVLVTIQKSWASFEKRRHSESRSQNPNLVLRWSGLHLFRRYRLRLEWVDFWVRLFY